MNVSVENKKPWSLEQIRTFLEGAEDIHFGASDRGEMYAWMASALCEQEYWRQGREAKGVLRRYLSKMSGLSRAQVTRLIARYIATGAVRERTYRRNEFPQRYTSGDIELLATVDTAHETLSGPATRKILDREFHQYGDRRYERLAAISVAHIYNLRKSRTYRQKRIRYEKTRPVQIPIGERRRPAPEGKPGYLRVDTVHQGDRDGMKGVYHINAVDEVTQWQIVGATAQISEERVSTVLKAILEQFPFRILGFHSDNGGEFINYTVAGLLNKLLVRQTKSRPRRSNDNGLVEAKNGAVIRKHIGYGYIESKNAEDLMRFYREHFNPYVNFHRPSGVPETVTDKKGKVRRVYRWYATPCEILRQIPDSGRWLKPGVTLQSLQSIANAKSDTQAASEMQTAKQKLFAAFEQKKSA